MRGTQNQRGSVDFSFGKVFIIGVAIVAMWAFYNYSVSFYQSQQIENSLSGSILRNRLEKSDPLLLEAVSKDLEKMGVKIAPEMMTVLRSTDGGLVKVSLAYDHVVKIPFSSKTWVIHWPVSAEERVNFAP